MEDSRKCRTPPKNFASVYRILRTFNSVIWSARLQSQQVSSRQCLPLHFEKLRFKIIKINERMIFHSSGNCLGNKSCLVEVQRSRFTITSFQRSHKSSPSTSLVFQMLQLPLTRTLAVRPYCVMSQRAHISRFI